MKSRLQVTLTAIILASLLTSCSAGSNENQNPESATSPTTATESANPVAERTKAASTEAESTEEVTETVPDISGEPNEVSDIEATVPVETGPVTEEPVSVEPETAEAKDGPTKKNLTYVAEKLSSYIAKNEIPSTTDGISGIAGDLPEFDDTTDIAYMKNEDGSWLLRAWNPEDANYKDSNTALTYHSVQGFLFH